MKKTTTFFFAYVFLAFAMLFSSNAMADATFAATTTKSSVRSTGFYKAKNFFKTDVFKENCVIEPPAPIIKGATTFYNVANSTTIALPVLVPIEGCTIEWHTVAKNPTLATKVQNSTAVAPGLYYAYHKNQYGYSAASVVIGAQIISKRAYNPADGSTVTTVSPDANGQATINWVINLDADIADLPKSMTVTDSGMTNGQTIVPGSLVLPANWTTTASTSNSFTVAGASNVANIGSFSINTLLTASSTKINSTGGDGYAVYATKDKIYQVNHHCMGVHLECFVRATGAPCFTTPNVMNCDTGVSATGNGISLVKTNVVAINGQTYTAANSSYQENLVLDSTGNYFYVPFAFARAGVSGGTGIVKYEIATNTVVAIYEVATTGTTFGPQFGGMTVVNNKAYFSSYTTSKIFCFDFATNANCAITVPNLPYTDVTPATQMELSNGNIVIAKINNDGTSTNYIAIYNPTTNTVSSTLMASAGDYSYIAPIFDTSGVGNGFCSFNSNGPNVRCWDNNGGVLALTGNLANITKMRKVLPANNLTRFVMFADNINNPIFNGKYFYPINDGSSTSSEMDGRVGCYDFIIGDVCAGWTISSTDTTPVKITNPGSGFTTPYTVQRDPFDTSCMWVSTDSGKVWNFSAVDGGACASASTKATPAFCDGKALNNRIQWATASLNGFVIGTDVTSLLVTISDANGLTIPGFREVAMTPNTYNISAITYPTYTTGGFTYDTSTLNAFYTLVGLTASGTAKVTAGGVKLVLDWTGDAAQICFKTIVCAGSGFTAQNTATASYMSDTNVQSATASSGAVSVTVNPSSKPVPTSNAIALACTGSTTANLNSVLPAAAATYEWHTVATNPTTATKVPDATAVGAGTYYLYTYFASTGCYSAASDPVVVSVTPVPAAPISGGDQYACSNGTPAPAGRLASAAASALPTANSLTATATVPAGQTINWYTAATGGFLVSPPVFDQIGTFTFYAEAVSSNGCVSATRTPVTLTIYPATAAPISGGDQSACKEPVTGGRLASAGASALPVFANSLTATATTVPAGQTITWYTASTGGSVVSPPSLSTPGTVTYYAETTASNGCVSPRTPVTLTLYGYATGVLGTVSCSAGVGTFTVTNPLGAGLEYSKDNTTWQTSTTFSGLANGSSYPFYVRNAGGCVTSPSTYTINCGCTNQPTVALSATSGSTCGIAPITVSNNTFGGSATAVTITSNGAGSVTASAAASPFSFTYTPAASDAGNVVTITVTTNNPSGTPCTAAVATYALTIKATPVAPISGGDQSACLTPSSGGNARLASPAAATALPTATSLTATATTVPAGQTITWYTASTGGSVVSPPTLSTVGTVTYYAETTSNGCVSPRTPVTLTIYETPQPGATYTQPTCTTPTGSVTFSGLPATGTWTINPGAVTGTGTTYTLNNIAPGTYNYTITSAEGCTSTANYRITINPVPAAPTLGGATSTCTGTTANVTPNNSGTWSSSNTAIATVTNAGVVTGVASGTVTLTFVNTLDSCSNTMSFTVLNPVAITITPATPGTVCVGGTTILHALPAGGTWTSNSSNAVITSNNADGTANVTINATGDFTFNYTHPGVSGTSCPNTVSNVTLVTGVAPPTAPVAVVTQPTCTTSTGSVAFSGLPATGTWTINPGAITGTGTTYTLNNVATGTYNYTVTSAAGCTSAPTAVTINAQPVGPAQPLLGNTVQPTCTVATGTFTITNYNAAYTYTFTPAGPTVAAGGVVTASAGSYTVIATASNTCTSIASANITINPQPATPAAPVAAVTQPTCTTSTGSVAFSGLPATGTWTLNPGAITGTGTTYTLNNVATGTYNYTVTNAAGCTSAPTAVTINPAPVNPAQPLLGNAVQPTCTVATGSFTITNYNAAYTYTISPSTGVSGPNASGVVTAPAGTYTATAVLGTCTSIASGSVTLNAVPNTPAAPVAVVTQPTCTTSTGSIAFSGLPATGTWTLNPGAITGTGTTYTLNNVATGTYNYTVTNAAGCTSAPTAVTINPAPVNPAQPLLGNAVQPTCTVATGSFTITNYNAAYTYTISPSTGVSGPNASGVVTAPAGTYTATAVSGTCTSIASGSVTLNAVPNTPAAPVAVVTQPTCTTSTGSIAFSGLPATGTWTLNPGAITGTGTTYTLNNVATGTYNYTVTNAAGCTSAPTAVTINPAPVNPAQPLLGNAVQPTCTVATGSFTITNYNAAYTYTISPSTGVSGPNASGVVTAPAGTYTATAVSGTCTSIASGSVTLNAVPNTPAAPVAVVTQPTCTTSTGSIAFSGLPATGTWTLNPGAITGTGTTYTLNNVATGTYNYTVTNAAGCTSAPTPVTINAAPVTPAQPLVSAITQPTCAIGTGSFAITNYNAAYTYTITPAGATQTGANVVASAGTYTITASSTTAGVTCTSLPATAVVNPALNTPATPVATVTQPTCTTTTGSVVFSGLPSTGTWTINPGALTGTGTTFTLNNVATGTYNYTVTNAAGCISAPVAVTINPAPVAPVVPTVSTTPATCSAAGTATISNYVATNTYTFSPAGPTAGAAGVISGMTGGTTYTVTSTANTCTSVASASFSVQPMLVTPVVPTVGTVTQPTCTTANGSFSITNYSASNTYSFLPATGTVISGPTSTGLVTATAGSYSITASANGCTSAPVVVVVNPQDCADIVTVKTDNKTSYVAGQPVTYTITVTNNGPTAAANVVVNDPAPAGTTITAVTGTGATNTANALAATILSMTVGQVLTYTITLAVPATQLGDLVNTVTVTSTTPDPVPGCTTCIDIDVPNTTVAINDINNTFVNTPVRGNVKTNDSDPEGNTQTVTPQTATVIAGQGTLTLLADGTYTFTPLTDWTGTTVFPYTTCDNGTPQACATATLTIEVMPNPGPCSPTPCTPSTPNDVVANDDTATTEAGLPVVIAILANDFDPNGDTINPPTVTVPPTHGTFDPGTGIYTPNAGYTGPDTFTYQICDTGSPVACDTAVVTINVTPVNPANTTVANDDAYNGDQYEPITGNVLTNDTDPEGNTQTVTPGTIPTNNGGTVVMQPNGTFVYTPTPGYTGPDQFTYTACDNGTPQACDTATVYLTVNPNNTTLAVNDINDTFVNTPVSGNVSTNDSDPQSQPQTVTEQTLTNAGEGTVHFNADGTYTFTPLTDWTGTTVFPYTTCDNGTPQACATATLTIEVMPNPGPCSPTPCTPSTPNDVVANDDTATTEAGLPVVIAILANDFDPNGDTINPPTVTVPPTHGTFDPGTGIYTPNAGYTGPDTFTYQICDTGSPVACDTAVVTINVTPVNPANTTVANDDAYNGDQYEPITGNVLTNDTDPEGNTQTVTPGTIPTNNGGTVVMQPNGTFVYTPTPGYTGPDQFTYTACDNGTPQACDTATVYLTVNPNNTTLAVNDINDTFVNTPVSGNVSTNDSDPQSQPQTVTEQTLTNAGEGTVHFNADGTYTFTPLTDWTGTTVFPYTTCDNGTPQACATATLTIEVMPNPGPCSPTPCTPSTPNDVVANDDTATTEAGLPVVIAILANDFDPNGDTINPPTVTVPPTHGTFDPGTGIYTPNAGYTGPDTFTYQICDTGSPVACDTAVVTINVTPVNPANTTVANDDAYNGDQYEPITGNVLTNDTDPEGNTQTVTPGTIPTNNGGTVVMQPNGTFVYTPTPGYTGPDQFTYTACDNGTPQACDTATVYLTVNPNNTTLAVNDINDTFVNTPVSGNVSTNDSDPQSQPQTVTEQTLTNAGEGTVHFNADGTYTFTPLTDWTGTTVFPYTTCDNGTPQACATATLTIEVMPNPGPCSPTPCTPSTPNDVVANDDTATTEAGLPVVIAILANDFDPNGDTINPPTVTVPPTHGTFDPGTGIYTPNAGYTGPDTFTYQICDTGSPVACDTAVVTINVTPVNPANTTVANDDAYNGDQYEPITGNVLTNDTDPEGNTQTVTPGTIPTNNGGTVVMQPNGTFVYTPTPGYTGPDQFTYTACDNGTPQACDTATVYLTVNPNNTTLAVNDINDTFVNTPVSGNVSTNDSDPQSQPQTVTEQTLTNAGEGTVHFNADGTYTFTPLTDWTGTTVFPYTTCDNGTPQACATATLTIEVMPNPGPCSPTPCTPSTPNDVVANDDTATTEAGLPVVIAILANDFDPNGDTINPPTVTVPPTHGTFDPGTGIYTPNAGYTGPDTFTYQICDTGSPVACDTAVVTINVTPVNPANTTVANDDAYNGDQYEPITGNVLTNDTDPEGNTQTVTPGTIPTNNGGTVVMQPNGTFVYTPTPGYTGPDQFTYTACDNGTPQACDTATVYLTVNPNNTTLAVNDINDTFVNTPVSGNVSTNDSDPQSQPQTVTEQTLTNAGEGTVHFNADGTYTFTPLTDWTGTTVFPYTTCDNGTPQACATANLTIEVMPNPNNPSTPNDVVANDDTATTEAGLPVVIAILANDFDPNGDTINPPTVTVPPTHGTFDPGTGIYTPNAGYTGPDTFTYQICDTGSPVACDTAVVTINVTPVNPANTTVANDDAYNGDGSTIGGNVLTNDTDPEGNPQTVTNYTQPTHGTVTVSPTGVVVYTPTPGYTGPDQFTYTACDNGNPQACDTATVYLTVNPDPSIKVTKDGAFVDAAPLGVVNAGDTIHYTFIVTNTGNVTLTNVTVTDVNATVTGGPLATLAVGASNSTTFTAVHILTQADIDAGNVYNLATATGTPPSGPAVTGTSTDPTPCATCPPGEPVCATCPVTGTPCTDCTIVEVPQTPSIKVVKEGTLDMTTAAPTTVGNIGDTVNYTFTVTNTGNVTLTNVMVTDAMVGIVITNPTVTPSTLVPGATGTATGYYILTQTDVDNEQVENIALATGTTPPTATNPSGTPVTDASTDPTPCATCTIDPTCVDCTLVPIDDNPALTITKDSAINLNTVAPNGVANVGDTIVYTFIVTNTGNVTLSNVTVTDAMAVTPAVQLVTPSTLIPGATGMATATYVLTQADIISGQVNNVATATGSDPKGHSATATSTDPTQCVGCVPVAGCPTCTSDLIPASPSITVTKDSSLNLGTDNVATVNDVVTYNFTVTNTGNVTLTNVTITDPILGTQLIQVTPTTLAPGEVGSATATYLLTQANIEAGQVNNIATVSGIPPVTPSNPTGTPVTAISIDPTQGCTNCTVDPLNPTATLTAVPQTPSIMVTKDANLDNNVVAPNGEANVGDVVTYSFVVTNTGNVTLNNISVTDTNLTPSLVVITPSTLVPGQIGTGTATYTLTQSDITAGVVYNLAIANGTGPVTPSNPTGTPVTDASVDPTNPVTPGTPYYNPLEPNATVIPLTSNPGIALVKTAAFSGVATNAQIGDIITYTFTVTNTGNVPLSNVSVSDALITNNSLVYVSGDTSNVGILDQSETWIYTATYAITQSDIISGQVTNQALSQGTSPATPAYPNGQAVTDLSDESTPGVTHNTPTVIHFDGCELVVYNALTPNEDGLNDYFMINGISCYPKNKVEIYNRWGVLVYQVDGYNNTTNAFTGYSNGRAVYKQEEGLPTGTYYYVIEYTDLNGNASSKAGYLYLTRD